MKRFDMSDFYNLSKPLRIFIVCACSIILLGMVSHIVAAIELRYNTNQDAVVTVSTIKAGSLPAIEEIVLPGNVQAWHEANIYARTAGYIKDWNTDIGAHVKAGDVLATIESPEVDAQLRQAEADLKTAQANDDLSRVTAARWVKLLKTGYVSKQDADEKVSDELAKDATVNSMLANQQRLKQLVEFENVIAPFDGIITSRTTDIGALIDEGSTTKTPLFHIVQNNPLRIYVQIPQNYSSRVSADIIAELHFSEHPGKIYKAKLFETAKAIDPSTRTLLAQFVMDNPNDEILPGGYTQVHLKFPADKNGVRLPVNAILFRAEGSQVAVLDGQNKVILKSIVIGRDYGNQVEIDSGLKPGEVIIVNPPDSIVTGQQVKIAN